MILARSMAWLNKEFPLSPKQTKVGLRLAITGCLVLAVGMYANFHWTKWALFVILAAMAQERTSGGLTGQWVNWIASQVVGCIIGVILMAIAPQNPIIFATLLGTAVYITTYCSLECESPDVFKFMRVAILVVAGLGLMTTTPTEFWGLWRVFQIIIAIVIAGVAGALIFPEYAHSKLDEAASEAIMEWKTDFLHVLSGIRRALITGDGTEGAVAGQLKSHSQLSSLFADARAEGTLTRAQKAQYGKIVARLEDLRSITSRLASHRLPSAAEPTEAQQALESVELETGKLLTELAHGISDSVDRKASTTALEMAIDQCARSLTSWLKNCEDVAVSIDHNAVCQSFVSTLREIPGCLRDMANSIYGLRTKTAPKELQKQDSKHMTSLLELFAHPDPMSVTGSLKIALTVIAVVILAWGLEWKSPVPAVCFASFIGGGLIYKAGLTLEGGRIEAMAWALGFVVAGVVAAFITVFAFPHIDRLPGLLILFFIVFFACGYFASGGSPFGLILLASSIALVLMLIGSVEKIIDLESIWHMVTSVLFGLIIAVVIQHLMWPIRAFTALRTKLAQAMETIGDYYRTSLESEKPSSKGKTLDDLAKNLKYQRVLWGQASRDTYDHQIARFPIKEVLLIEQRLADAVSHIGRLDCSGFGMISALGKELFNELDQAILAKMRSLAEELRTGELGSESAAGLDQNIQDALLRLTAVKKNRAHQPDVSEETFRVLEILYYRKKAIAEDLKQLALSLRTTALVADHSKKQLLQEH